MALWRRLPVEVNAVVLRHMRRDTDGAQIGHMIGGVIGRNMEFRPPFQAP